MIKPIFLFYIMKSFFIIFMLLISSCALLHPNPNRNEKLISNELELKPFTSDYCSEWPDGRILDPKRWADCCFTHDLNYWIGGTESDRKQSDVELKSCVKNFSDSLNSFLMYTGVRLGGDPGEASYAWGYGWTKDRKYFERTSSDISKARELLQASDYNKNKKEKDLIEKFIEQKLK
jgi:hypothetical protein